MPDRITIKGARQNNLKNIDLSIPKNRIVVITGPSGAGKSSLAFDTIYAEGQRRYVESLSNSARQYLTQLEKPDVDSIEGLGPAIAIGQRAGTANPRSTVGTVTEIYDFLRLLYARVARPVCHRCGETLLGYTVQQIVDEALTRPEGTRLLVCAPIQYDSRLDFGAVLEGFQRDGFVRIRLGGKAVLLEEEAPDPPGAGEALELVTDRLSISAANKQRLTEAVELAINYSSGGGMVRLVYPGPSTQGHAADDKLGGKPAPKPAEAEGGEEECTYSRTPRCGSCGITYPDPQPRNFSFNSPFGACPDCHGLGHTMKVGINLVVPDFSRSLAEGAVAPWERKSSASFKRMIEQVAAHYGFSIFTPFSQLSEEQQEIILQGSGEEELEFSYQGEETSYHYSRPFEGVGPNLERRFRETESAAVREEIRRYMVEQVCRSCNGQRLSQESLHFLLEGLSISDVTALGLEEARNWCRSLRLSDRETAIAAKLLEEISARLGFLLGVGLHYLTLERPMNSLSNGETQRIRLATQIGSALSGVIYILDEPTIGLHQRDTKRLMVTLARLRDAGNSVLVVEHDREVMEGADYLIEIGPKAGEEGGRLVAQGTLEEIKKQPDSKTGRYLSGRNTIPLPQKRRGQSLQKLEITGATGHNLKDITLEIPLNLIVCVTGVSGSGKSSLVLDTLYPALLEKIHHKSLGGLPYRKLRGHQFLERVIHIDQSPIGKSTRSNPGTYLGVFNLIREQFAKLPESRIRGYQPRRFSFNMKGGRCETCQGEGVKRIEMHFLPDVFVKCDICQGSRYNRETLEIRYRGKRIDEILNFTVKEVEKFFRAIPAIRQKLQPMLGVGLDYLKLGQAANTLSCGEAQRLKIARELGRKATGRTLYIMDEPTTGLHFEEVERIVNILNQLVETGNSVLVIEHNLELIKCADYLIDLGPEAGEEGGEIMATGTPEELLSCQDISHTALFLPPYLSGGKLTGTIPNKDKERYLHDNPLNSI